MLFRNAFSLKKRILWFYVLILAIIIVVLGLSFFESARNILISQFTDNVVNKLAFITKNKNITLQKIGRYLSEQKMDFLVIDHNYKIIAKSTNTDMSFGAERHCLNDRKETVCMTVIDKKDFIIVTLPIKIKDGSYMLQVYKSAKRFNDLLKRYIVNIVLGCFLTFLIGCAVWFFVVYAIFSELREVAFRLNKIANGNLSFKGKLPVDSDEMGDIMKSINTIIENYAHIIKRQGEFSTLMAHELKTPISILKGSLEIILKNTIDLNGVLKLSGNMLKEVDRLASLSDKLLDITSLKNTTILNKTTFDISEFIKECVEDIKVVAQTKDIIIKERLAVNVFADKSLIRRVVFNILDNAIKYTDANGLIEIYWHLEKNGISVSIKDNGEGVNPDDIDKIFDPFYRSNKRKKGTGLGLAFCKSVMDAHGGYINVTSRPDEGAVFTFFLPFS